MVVGDGESSSRSFFVDVLTRAAIRTGQLHHLHWVPSNIVWLQMSMSTPVMSKNKTRLRCRAGNIS